MPGLLWGLLLVLVACSGEQHGLAPTRGFILISIDTLRADHVGAYGSERDTTPFLDSLAARGALFENEVVQLPGTLPSHMSIFTGLYPDEHGVFPPDSVLSQKIETIPEAFSRAGFRTAGFTEGGYMSSSYGFARGFDRFSHQTEERYDDIERTFGRGLDFLRSVDASDRFFLFLHTYAVHDPYEPPEPYRSMFWEGPPPESFEPTGANLEAVNLGLRTVTRDQVRYFEALYDGGIRYMDSVLQRWFDQVEALGLLQDTTVIITSDHGEEFLDHGMLVHEQVYHENLHVPLVILHPAIQPGARIKPLVQSVDLAPTLYDVARISPEGKLSGQSLVPLVVGEEPQSAEPRIAFAESFDRSDQALYHQSSKGLFHLLRLEPPREEAGTWIGDSVTFDARGDRLAFRGMSFHEPREVAVVVDGELAETLEFSPTWSTIEVELPPRGAGGRRHVELRASGCLSPSEVSGSPDERCLAFRVQGLPLDTTELYDVGADPGETRDLTDEREDLFRELYRRLARLSFELVAPPDKGALNPELERRLKSLGYLR